MTKNRIHKLLIAGLCVALLSGCGKKAPAAEAAPVTPVTPEATPVVTVPQPVYGIADYFPITENTEYKYEGQNSESLTQQAFTLFTSPNGCQVFTENFEYNVTDVYRIADGELRVLYTDVNYYYDNLLDTLDVAHITVLKEPFELGSTWDYDRAGAVCEITSLDASVDVPYGKFDGCLEVTITHEGGTIQRDYYARGVGLVMTGYSIGNTELAMRLAEVIPHATKEVSVDFFLANSTLDKQELEQRPLVLTTNMDFKEYFNTELKKTPGVDYQPLLPGASQIQSLSVDWTKVLLTVNLSADYASEIGAGAGIESMALQALANTLGNFYHVTSVEILLNNRPYQSGHISRADGEYWDVELPETLSPEAALSEEAAE